MKKSQMLTEAHATKAREQRPHLRGTRLFLFCFCFVASTFLRCCCCSSLFLFLSWSFFEGPKHRDIGAAACEMGKRGQRAFERTLVCVIQALMGLELLVELRNDLSIRGILDDCDNAMNVIIKDATVEDVEGVQKQLPLVFLRGSNIRFVHIPDNVDIMKLVEERRLMLDQAATAYTGKGAPAPKPQASVTTA
uniref:Sm domain-containing protein n=2 Tax=Physcomitrium patens TaxID=3218 RepID=A0A7I4A520_PHYPA